jgi:hypothetical protein
MGENLNHPPFTLLGRRLVPTRGRGLTNGASVQVTVEISDHTLSYGREDRLRVDRVTVLGLILSGGGDAAMLVAVCGIYLTDLTCAGVTDFAWVELLLLGSFAAAFVGTGLSVIGALRTRRGRWAGLAFALSVVYWVALANVLAFGLV